MGGTATGSRQPSLLWNSRLFRHCSQLLRTHNKHNSFPTDAEGQGLWSCGNAQLGVSKTRVANGPDSNKEIDSLPCLRVGALHCSRTKLTDDLEAVLHTAFALAGFMKPHFLPGFLWLAGVVSGQAIRRSVR